MSDFIERLVAAPLSHPDAAWYVHQSFTNRPEDNPLGLWLELWSHDDHCQLSMPLEPADVERLIALGVDHDNVDLDDARS